MSIEVPWGSTGVTLRVKILDSSVATGAGLTGLTHASTGLRIAALADNESATTAYTAAAGTIETIATLGEYTAPAANCCRFREVDAVNHPGVYELQLADARFAVAGAKSLLVSLSGAADAAETDLEVAMVARIYHADLFFNRTDTRDEYTVAWFRDGVPLVSGVSEAALEVLTRAGSVLIAATAMTAVGSTATYDAINEERQTLGSAYRAIVTATIDGATRTWPRVLGRDA